MDLQPLDAGHEAALLEFELENRAYFTRFIGDRGEEFFRDFSDNLRARLADQEQGVDAYYVLVEHGAVVGRFNLYDLADSGANLGYRVAEHVAGRGVASAAVRELCRLAREEHGLRTLRAATSEANTGSQRVLEHNGFRRVGPAGADDLGGRHGWWYERSV